VEARPSGVSVPARARKELQVEPLLNSEQLEFATHLGMLHRDERRRPAAFCGLDDSGRARRADAALRGGSRPVGTAAADWFGTLPSLSGDRAGG
jgi:hypothetical protein